MMRMSVSLAALGLLAGCSVFDRGNPAPPPPEFTQRTGADRQVPAAGIATNRGRARHDADDPALDESRGQPIGSIVPRDQSSKKPPAAVPPDAKL